MSLRLRLTLWYTILLAGLLILVLVITLSVVQASVSTNIDKQLKERGDQIVRLMEITAPSEPLSELLLPTLGASFETEVYVQVRDRTRRTTHRSGNLVNKSIPLPEPFYRQALNGTGGYYNLSTQSPNDMRVYFAPIMFGGEVIGLVQVARNLAPEQAILSELASNLIWIMIVALAAGAGVGYWLAGVALRPIEVATATARAITRTGRLDRRVPMRGTAEDEIGTLISTFNEMLERLEELFEKQRRFSGDISHELRTPLTTILGNVSLLKRAGSLPPDEQREMLNEIETEAQRMHRLISDLLLLAQADADLVIARKRVELDTLLLDVYNQAKRRVGDSLEITLIHEDQVSVLGDVERLRQVLVNLINNAIQYTPPGGRIELGLSQRQGLAEIMVRDTGQGIAPEDLPFIFDRFYRADRARTRAAGGTGLGLSIVKWVVDAHQGEIEVESEPGAGTTFRVYLPLYTASGNQQGARPQPARITPSREHDD
ncbi:MAG: sensor histidine kinase [Caldilineae bacterium]|nr:MAG: sensor histidine kinase [Caldilineae bacterium]